MEFTGRITADAKVSTVKADKEVVNFSVAINDRYRSKGSNETKEFVTFINVAWWMGPGIAKILRKGAIVTVTGRLYVTAYKDMQGEAKASINCHASEIKLVHSKKSEGQAETNPVEVAEPVEDLPF
ncbi:MAG: single-stranded DNA-binding protein [Sediminibacterium magnilacihabitans]|jgi:single-strand DNA-binding protein|nr:single-stranded DNA-binding protein [Sediminibacterium magnilacihabitans]PQV59485.1 single-strand DNA-binding protein [Sediminibacterium magnilacihabitans]